MKELGGVALLVVGLLVAWKLLIPNIGAPFQQAAHTLQMAQLEAALAAANSDKDAARAEVEKLKGELAALAKKHDELVMKMTQLSKAARPPATPLDAKPSP